MMLIVGIGLRHLSLHNRKYAERIAIILEKERHKRATLQKELNESRRQMKALVADNNMRLLFKKQLLEQLKEDHSLSISPEVNSYTRGLILKMKLQIATENKLSSVQKKVHRLNTEFQSKIVELYPSITKNEREVCSLLRLNLSIKEVASIRNTTIGSVKIIRHRIRKKMDVPEGEILEDFVQSL
ncbi:hypothetical protein RQM59_01210 [Flavobacteriaceae bacterium S356]|uniref:HTH luxR-type domain-containing protein n=1 Tax=Asprobacillus argus TaxID=3076534 RepID=A0ABU3LB64_9FLAO|nr:hypothetical protein [Flavobacteriaceae bacterium S356]